MKLAALAKAPQLHFHKKFNKVYVSADRTRFEMEKHRKLVEKLKRQRELGKRNLIIRNWSIVHRQPRRPYPFIDVPLISLLPGQPELSDSGGHQSR